MLHLKNYQEGGGGVAKTIFAVPKNRLDCFNSNFYFYSIRGQPWTLFTVTIFQKKNLKIPSSSLLPEAVNFNLVLEFNSQ